ncbi:hypothetical protein QVD17_37960 [Tagetes erecta]|uniref:Uncharacterized protein n=1 Tax=Tagetes erecta TaxID=13708 RepID=A0AAD8JXR4_TARER|nr:hypothetical protein QVD17_37960 [Tagetes erecta]
MGRGSRGQGTSRVGSQGSVPGDRGDVQGSSQGMMARSMEHGAGCGGTSRGSSQGCIQASVRDVVPGITQDQDMDMSSPIEGSDDESTFIALKRRGQTFQGQLPEPMNHEWIWIKDGEISNQKKSTRLIRSILKSMWNGPWESWRDVPIEDRTRLFEHFQV